MITSLILLLTLLAPLYYTLENNRLYHYMGISTVGEHDLFDKIIQYQLNPYVINPARPYTKIMINCLIGKDPNNSIVNSDCIAPMNLGEDKYYTKSAKILGSFASEVILKQPLTFIFKSISLLPHTTTILDHDPFSWISTYSSNPFLARLWSFLYFFYGKLHFLVLSFFIFYPYQLYQFFKTQLITLKGAGGRSEGFPRRVSTVTRDDDNLDRISFFRAVYLERVLGHANDRPRDSRRSQQNPPEINTILTIIGTIILYVLFFNTFFVQFEYSRLRAPVEPLLFLFCSYYFFSLINWFLSIMGKHEA